MRRRRREQAVNLFAFQDIITGVAGVMLFVLLLLVVQLSLKLATQAADLKEQQTEMESFDFSQPDEQNKSSDSKESFESLQERLDRLRRENQNLIDAVSRDLKAEIETAQAELAEIIRASDKAKTQANALQQEIASQAVSAERKEMLEQRRRLQEQLKSLKEEELRHKSGKLVAFKTTTNQSRQMWVVDVRDSRAELFDVEQPADVTIVRYDRKNTADETAGQIKAALERKTKTKTIILVIRPSLGGAGAELLSDLRGQGFNIALELLDEDTQITESGDASIDSSNQGGQR